MKGIILILSLGMICFTTLAIADFEQEKPHKKSIFVEYVFCMIDKLLQKIWLNLIIQKHLISLAIKSIDRLKDE